MVSSLDGITDSSPNLNNLSGHSPSRIQHSRDPVSESKMEDIRLQSFRTRYQSKGFSRKSIDLLAITLDPNSSKTVSSNLRTWICWCHTKSVDPVTCDLNSICEFFSDQLSEGKAANTIAGYRSAISEIHDPVDGQSIGNHPDISRAIAAVMKENPPALHNDDIIDITPSLEFIISLGNNESMTFRNLSLKTVFLIALVTASRPSDLTKIDMSTAKITNVSYSFECIAPKESKIALAHAPSTTKRRSKTVFIGSYSDNPHLCPYSALKTLISRTSHLRTSNDRKRSIFLITKQPYTPASVDTVANWIKEVMKKSSQSLTARDVRSTSASLAQNSGADLATVLALGNWSSNSTYQRFYQRGVKLMLERNNISRQILNEALGGTQDNA